MKTITKTIKRNTQILSLSEMKEFITSTIKNTTESCIYRIVIENTDPSCKWGVDNNQIMTIVLDHNGFMNDYEIFDYKYYLNNTYIEGSAHNYYNEDFVELWVYKTNIDPFKLCDV